MIAVAEKVAIQKNAIYVVDGGKNVTLKFKYNPDVVNAVKACINRKFNPDEKSWTIPKCELPELVSRLQKIPDIDCSGIESIVQKATDFSNIEVKPLINNTRIPFNHQWEACKFLLANKKAILADEMGGGKTISAILAGLNVDGKKLVICPASLKLNWRKEILSIDSTAKISIVNGKEFEKDADWYIINYDILGKFAEYFEAADFNFAGFKVLIADEAHYIKSINNSGKPTAERAKMTMRLAEKMRYVFLLTGTPITNKTKDIFNLLKAIGHPLTDKWMQFAMRYCAAERTRWGWDMDGSSNRKELHEKIKPVMMRRLKEELLELPDKIRRFIPVEIDIKEYQRQFDDYMSVRKDITHGEALVRLNALKHILAVQKVDSTIEQIESMLEQDKPVVVFTCYEEVVNQITKHFPQAGKITGDCSVSDRQKTVDDFQKGSINLVVCNIVAGGVGITLTVGDTVIFNDFDWVPSNHLQAEDRIHRIGQNQKCNIIYMYAENAMMDARLSEIIENKITNINAVVDGKNESVFEDLLKKMNEKK